MILRVLTVGGERGGFRGRGSAAERFGEGFEAGRWVNFWGVVDVFWGLIVSRGAEIGAMERMD